MPVWKLDLVFEAQGRGWEETYYKNFSASSFGGVNAEVSALADKRILLSADPVVIKAYRVSDPLTSGKQGQAFYFNPKKNPGGAGGAEGSATPSAAINVEFISNTNNSTRRIQMRGIWDAAIRHYADLDSPSYGNWYTYFLQWRTYVLQQGYGWLSRPQVGDSVQVTYNYDIDPLIPEFTFPADWFPADQVNKFRPVRFSRFNGSSSPLNRELIVFVTARNKAVAAAPIAAGPMISPGRAIRYGTPTLVVADNIGVSKVGRRAPGAPLLHTPGRARARARS